MKNAIKTQFTFPHPMKALSIGPNFVLKRHETVAMMSIWPIKISSMTIAAIVSSVLLPHTLSAAESKGSGGSTRVAVSPSLQVKVGPPTGGQEVKPTPPVIIKKVDPTVLQIWKDNRGGEWFGGDGSSDVNSFYNSGNWKAPASPRSDGEGFDLHFSGSGSLAQASRPLGLFGSSALIVTDGASLDLNNNAVHYSGKAVLIVDSAYLEDVGSMMPVDKDSTLDLMVTNNAMINGVAAGLVCDFGGGALLVTDSNCSFTSLVRGKVKISGYGSVEVSGNSKQVIEGSAIDLTSPRAQFRFVDKPLDRVISEDLDKFSISGALPIYGSNPEVVESGDNILIRKDGGTGTTLTVVR